MASFWRTAALTTGAAAFAAAAAAHVWARHIEPSMFRLREVDLDILPPGAGRLRILHISDAHLMPDQQRKLEFLSLLGTLRPDVVVNTGDNVAAAEAIDPMLEALAPLLASPGVFVLGSNDKYAAGKRNLFRYLLADPRQEDGPQDPELPTERLVDAFTAAGWFDADNRRGTIAAAGVDIDIVGVDDPHLDHDEYPPLTDSSYTESTPGRPRIRLGIVHAPYQRVISAMVAEGCDLIVAGHTHGGQLALPFVGALVTNCDLPRSQAKGISWHRGVPLHVSGGLGANPFYNMRTANPPEATLLTLRERR